MDKKVLNDYVDACALVKETEEDIRKLKKKRQTIIQGSVKGSMKDFPYAEKNFHIEGTTFTYKESSQLRIEEKLLEERKEDAEWIKQQVDEWMNSIPVRMQRIIRYKIFKDLSWEETATLIARKATGDSVRMEFKRFMGEI